MASRSLRRGSALLTVLWLTAALSAIGLAVANNVRGETERAATNVDDSRAWFLARGGIERVVLHMQWGQPFYTYTQRTMDLDFPSASVHVDLIPEASKLNLNGARPDELARLLEAMGLAPDRALEITQAIVDWRTPDTQHVSPLDAFYVAQSPSFLPRHASFIENEELLLVKGITPELYYGTALQKPGERSRAGLRDCVSVFGSSGMIDINTARAETMQAVGVGAADADEIVKLRTGRLIVFADLQRIVQATGPAGQRLGMAGGSLFTLRSTARMKQVDGKLSDMRRTVAALVRLGQDSPDGVTVLRWFDRG